MYVIHSVQLDYISQIVKNFISKKNEFIKKVIAFVKLLKLGCPKQEALTFCAKPNTKIN